MFEMGIFEKIIRLFKKKEVKRAKKEVEMPKPWSRVEKYKKINKNNFY